MDIRSYVLENSPGITVLSPPELALQPTAVAGQEREVLYMSPILAMLLQRLKAKDVQLYRHSFRVHYLTYHLARMLCLPESEITAIGLGALLHDIGKLYIRDALLQKATQLTPQEFMVIKKHPAYGAYILSHFELLASTIPVVYAHHERWDGAGYPSSLQGETIPLGARMVAIADAFEVMISYRTYQLMRTPADALEELSACAGTQFDPVLVDCFCRDVPVQLAVDIN